jgi:acyl-CoA synthetase (AMP-forming)/AMP-acid ligase II/acyl carrier protein
MDDNDNAAAILAAKGIGLPVIRAAADVNQPAGWLSLSADGHVGAAPSADGESHPALLLHTSGTTARPKLVPLSQENLVASALNIQGWLKLTQADCCLNIMPLFHIHGLVGALLSSLAGGSGVICSSGFNATRFLDDVHEQRPTWYTAVPTMHQAIAARGEVDPLRCSGTTLRFIRSSSAALAPQVALSLETLFGVPVVESYGMTEAAHQMCANPLPPATRKPGSVGVAAGPEVAVMDEKGVCLPVGKLGEVVIRGANVTAGYENNDAGNREAFHGHWFRTGDLGSIDADGYVTLAGRIKEIINRGGEKISPREIDEVLLDHPAIATAVAFAVPDARLGEEIAAAVVLRAGRSATEPELIKFAAARMVEFKVPRKIVFLEEIPKGPTGKVQRIGLARQLKIESIAPAVDAGNPSNEQMLTADETVMAAIWCEVLRVTKVNSHDDFHQLGGDSLLAAQVIARVRSRLGRSIPITAFFIAPTLSAITAAAEPVEASQTGMA